MKRRSFISTANKSPKKICFVCTANLCRSPFAESYLKNRLSILGIGDFEVVSCGTQASFNMRVPANLIEIASEFDVDLEPHRSQPLSLEVLKESRFILGMEKGHVDEVNIRFPNFTPNVYMLRQLADKGSKTRGITDPIGLSPDFVRACYDDIAEAIEGVIQRLS